LGKGKPVLSLCLQGFVAFKKYFRLKAKILEIFQNFAEKIAEKI